MLTLRKTTVLSMACVLAAASLAWGQAAVGMSAQVTAGPAKASPVLEVVPAGTLGFVVAPNIGKSFAAVQDYLKTIGVAELVPDSNDLLKVLKEAAQLGEGLNAEGGFAAALLDPQPFGVDFLKMIQDSEPASQPAGAEKPKVPLVLFVPASGLKEVFGKYEMKPEGELTKITFRAGEGYAAMLGGYAVVSPNGKAVQAVLKADKKAVSELSKEALSALLSADVGVHVNLKAAGPILKGLLEFAAQQAKEAPRGAMPFSPDQMLGLVGKMLAEMRDLTFTLQIGKTGVVFQEYLSLDPDGAMGKAMAAIKPGQSASLDRLPDLPYVLAIGSLPGAKGPWNQEMMDLVLKALPGLTDQVRSKITAIQQGLEGQVTAMQLVIGGAPPAAADPAATAPATTAPAQTGVFGVDIVLSCKDSAKVKGLLGDAVETVTDVIAALSGKEESTLKVAYVKDAEKLGAVSLDAISVTHPKIAELGDEEKAAMKKVLGEDKIRLLVAAPDDKTVVITFGGGTAMMAEALKLAKGGGAIPTDPGVVEIMKVMPKDLQGLVVIDPSRLMAVVRKAAAALGADLPPIQITCKTPIAIGAGVRGASVHEVFFIPNDLVKDGVNLWKMFSGAGR